MRKIVLEFGPLAAFFAAYQFAGLKAATGVIIISTLLALAVTYALERKLALTALITGVAVTVFGGLTLALGSEEFIKMKPTIVNLVFAFILLGGVYIGGRGLLKPLFGQAIELSEPGWRVISRNYGFFFLGLAALNEIIWRNFSTDFWVDFKVFGMLTCSLVFSALQVYVMRPYTASGDE